MFRGGALLGVQVVMKIELSSLALVLSMTAKITADGRGGRNWTLAFMCHKQ